MFRFGYSKKLLAPLFGGVLILSGMVVTAAHGQGPVTNHVKMQTSLGDIVIELNRQKAPVTCENFMRYVNKGFYNGTIFHRVIPNFMIQGGGFTSDMQKKEADPPIRNEWTNGLKNTRGSIAMARLGGRPDSATCEFFINVQHNPGLDHPRDGAGYAVFGHVVEGLEVVDRIKVVRTTFRGASRDVPTEPVVIKQIVGLDDRGAGGEAGEAGSSSP